MELLPKYQLDPNAPGPALHRLVERQAGPARRRGQASHRRRPADRRAPRPAARGHHLVQPRCPAFRWATPWTASKRLARESLPDTVRTSFQGVAAAFQSSLTRHGRAARHGDPGDLHGAGHSLRELHPPHHDSLGPALGRTGRAGHAAGLPRRAQYLLVRRHHHADRHRQEERHHDDRFRARSAARARRPRPPTRSTKPAWCASAPS